MKKIIIGFVFGSGLLYLTLSFQPSFLVTVEGTTDSTSVQADTALATPEIPTPANVSIDTTSADTTQK